MAGFKSGLLNDASDNLANHSKLYIELLHVPSGEKVKFKAFITQFDDQYQTEFSQEQVYGRMDAIQSYRGTTRQINLSWDVPSSTEQEASQHMKRCSKLMNMLYPVYSKVKTDNKSGGGKVMSAPPIFKMKFANLITNAQNPSGGSIEDSGLFGTISGFSYTPDMESGFFNVVAGNETRILPQTISLSCTFTVIHTHDLGWEKGSSDDGTSLRQAVENYPYGVSDDKERKPAARSGNDSQVDGDVNAANELNITDSITGG
jgi:hypothetical protein